MKNSIAKRIIFLIILFSSVVTFVTTGLQMIAEYNIKIDEVKRELEDIESSFSVPLTNAIWFLDKNQIQKQMEGISKLPHISKVTLASKDIGLQVISSDLKDNGTEKVIPLVYNKRFLGELKIVSSKDVIYQNIIQKSFWILLSNSIKTFLVALFALYIFNKLITAPLAAIAQDSTQMTLEQRSLFKKRNVRAENEDELDQVHKAIHEMQANFHESYKKLKSAESRIKDIASLNLASLFETDDHLTYVLVHNGNDEHKIRHYVFEGGKLFDLPLNQEHRMLLFSQNPIGNLELTIADQTYVLTLKPFYEEKNQIFKGYRGTVINITEKIKIEKKLSEQNEHLRQIQKIESIGLMTAGISHDLNNLLSVMNTSLQLIKDPTVSEDQKEKCIRNAQDAVQKSATMLRKLMDFSRKDAIKPILIDLSDELLSMENILKATLNSHGSLSLDLKSRSKCKLDRNQLETMLVNMVINSKDAMPSHGHIEIITRDIELINDDKVPNGKYVQIDFKDNGHGISPDIIHKIFDPFFTTKDLGKGTGLGLSTVMTFVQQNNGHIKVKSELEIGTTFSFYFPTA